MSVITSQLCGYHPGGKENYASDRAAAARLIELEPAVPRFARLNREFLVRAVGFVARQGASQFLDVGAGLPTQDSVHQVAQAVDPDAVTVYADNDPVVLAHSRALLSESEHAAVVAGDIRDPAKILGDAEVRGLIDFRRPACVLLVAIVHFVRDEEDPASLVAAFRDALAPGSYLVLSHGTAHGAPPEVVARSRQARRVYDNASAQITFRDPEAVSAMLAGFSLAEPGLVHISQWRPPVPVPYEFDGFLAAVGKVT